MRDREYHEVREINCETHFSQGKGRFERPVFAAAPCLGPSFNAILGCAREVGFVVDERFQNCSSVIERKTDSQRKQAWQKENLFHPCPWMQLALGTNIKNRHRSRCCEKNWNINQQRAQPPTLRSSGRGVQKHTETSKQQVGEVRHQMPGGFELDRERKAAAPNGGQ